MIERYQPRIFVGFLILWGALVTSAMAQDVMTLQITMDPPQAAPIEVDLDTLDSLEQVSFNTTTIWTDGQIEFSGVPLKSLLAHVAAEGIAIEMVALNDYAVSMPIAELEDDAPIIATRMDGKTMPVRDKGPYWLVFPYDKDPKYRSETVFSRSIWQLNRLRVLETE